MAKRIGKVRRSQLISTYGIGAIIPLEEGSVMVAGLEKWAAGNCDINEPRLSRKLGVRGFVRPPASESENAPDIPVVRFPAAYYCPGDCKRVSDIKYLTAQNSNKCLKCNVKLIPSRFIIVCPKGHIDDFPYFEWVHKGHSGTNGQTHALKLNAKGVSASLRDIEISCTCGVPPRTMEGSFAFGALKNIKKCRGRRPWIGDFEECDQTPRTLQRGASNVYFPIVQSALSIPPWSEGAYKIINSGWNILQFIPEIALKQTISDMKLANGTPYTADQLVQVVIQRKKGEAPVNSLLEEEYTKLCEGHAQTERTQDFVCEETAGFNEVSDIFERVMVVPKLKEVRALTGFTRLRPPVTENDVNVAKLSYNPPEWFPAIEVLGEGVFFRLSNEKLTEWEKNPLVTQRADKINQNYREKMAEYKQVPQREITPRFLLIHTLAHALIQQWSLDCGYPAGSLRERLYVSEPAHQSLMTGLLIYTATTDAAGSLGGVVALADENRLRDSVVNAILRASWCSADPLCVEADASGSDSLNLAACHACVLLPETSCEQQNYFLDRAMIVGTPTSPEIGFFEELLQ
jgi:hypothetical protein